MEANAVNRNASPTTLTITGGLTFYDFCCAHDKNMPKVWSSVFGIANHEGDEILKNPCHPFNQSGKVADIFPTIDISKASYDELFELRSGLMFYKDCCDGRRKRGKRYQSLLNAIGLVTAEFNRKLAEAACPAAAPDFHWPTDPAYYA